MRFAWFVILICFALAVSGQNSSQIRQLEKQRKEALTEIEQTSKLLDETTLSAKSSLNRLNLLSTQLLNRKKLISVLSQEMDVIDNQINTMQNEINALQKDLKGRQDNYVKSVQSMQKQSRSPQDKLLFILSADNFTQSMRRMRYLREYAGWQKKQAEEIVEKQKEIKGKQIALEGAKDEKRSLLVVREREREKLQTEEQNQKTEVQQLDKKRKQLQADLQKKRRQANELNRLIEQQIAKEIVAAEEAEQKRRAAAVKAGKKPEADSDKRTAEAKGGYAMTEAEKILSTNFSDNRGKLPAPVSARYTIVAHFGEHQHQDLKYVRVNNSGIDLRTSPGADALAVFNGVVTRAFVVPGYNNSVIVRHGNYLTVYSNLSKVYVKPGDKIKTRQPLGEIFVDTAERNATVLHFQLWKEKIKLNPAPWISR